MEASVGVFDANALPETVEITEVGAQADLIGDRLVSGELAAVVVGDGAPRLWHRSAQFGLDCAGGRFRVFAEKTTGQCQPGVPVPLRQENFALAAEVREIAIPAAELAAKMGLCRSLVGGGTTIKCYAGLDVSQEDCAVCILKEDGTPLWGGPTVPRENLLPDTTIAVGP